MDKMEPPEQPAPGPDISTTKLCPYFSCPLPGCYCENLTSLSIPFVLRYCHGNQINCEIYLRGKHTA